jgi:hypothetical protein
LLFHGLPKKSKHYLKIGIKMKISKCPQCQSSSTQTFQEVYENGKSYEVDPEIGTIIRLTPLAKKCSPPEKPKFGCLFVIITIFISINFGDLFYIYFFDFKNFNILFLLFLLLIIHVVFGFIFAKIWQLIIGKKRDHDFIVKYKKWEKYRLCQNCKFAFDENGNHVF